MVQGGKLAGVGAHSYSAGNAAKASGEAAKFKQYLPVDSETNPTRDWWRYH